MSDLLPEQLCNNVVRSATKLRTLLESLDTITVEGASHRKKARFSERMLDVANELGYSLEQVEKELQRQADRARVPAGRDLLGL